MSSSGRTRRRRQQKSLQRHHLRLEGLEKRYALDGSQSIPGVTFTPPPESLFTVTIDDPHDLVSSVTEQKLNASADYVMRLLQNNIAWQGVLDAEIQVRHKTEDPHQNHGIPSIVSLYWTGTDWSNDALHEMKTGFDRQPDHADVGCVLYLEGYDEITNHGSPVWFDSSPTRFNYEVSVNPTVPAGEHDFIGVFTHEVFHGLGFSRYAREYNELTTSVGDFDFFVGSAAQAVYGGPLPLAPTDIRTFPEDHYGNTSYPENTVSSGLLYQWGNHEQNRLDIGKIDLAVLEDLGVNVHTTAGLPTFDIIDSQNSTVLAAAPSLTGYRQFPAVAPGSGTIRLTWNEPDALGALNGQPGTLVGYQLFASSDNGTTWIESDLLDPTVTEVLVSEGHDTDITLPIYQIAAVTEAGRGFVGPASVQNNSSPFFDRIFDWTEPAGHISHPLVVTGITAGFGDNQPLRITASNNATVDSYISPESTAEIRLDLPLPNPFLPGDISEEYTITVEDGGFDNNLDTASDNGTYSQSFTVTVPSMYVPDPPYDLYLSDASVNENEQDATVGYFYSNLTDPTSLLVFSLTAGLGDTDNGLFYIEGDLLKTNTSFNYEAQQTASIRVRVENSAGHYDQVLEITIENVNEPPYWMFLPDVPVAVEENLPSGSPVRHLFTNDPDDWTPDGRVRGTFTYALVQGAGDENNGSFKIVDDVLQTNEIFDYESKDSYSIRVRTTDSGGLSFEKYFPINISNSVNERPILDPSASPQLNLVIEDTGIPVGPVGTLVSDLIDTEGPLNNFHDDDGDLPGIRIVGTNPQVEDIWFTIDGGAQWNKVNNISRANSLLLFADTQTRIYITGVADYSGALSEAIEFQAWDRTGSVGEWDHSYENGAQIVFDPVMFSYDTPETHFWGDIEISPDGKHAFVGTTGMDGVLQVFNIENPLQPELVSTNNAGSESFGLVLSSDGQHLFHNDGFSMKIIDVSSPEDPSVVANVGSVSGWRDWCLTPDEKYLYTAESDYMGPSHSIQVIDIQDFNNSVLVGSLNVSFFVYCLTASADGKYIYAAGSDSPVLHVIDITDPVNPIYDYAVNANSNVLDIAVSPDGQYVYVTSEHALEVFQPIPFQAVPVPAVPAPGPVPPNSSIGSPHDGVELVPVGELLLGLGRPFSKRLSFSANGQQAYLASDGEIIHIDIADPVNPQLIKYLPVGGYLDAVEPSNDPSFVFATDSEAGFRVVDVTQSVPGMASPGGVGYVYRPSSPINDITMNSDDTLIGLAATDGVHLLDGFKQLLSKIDMNEGANVLEMSSNDNFLCYADDTSLRVVDIRDPLNPFETSHIPLSDLAGSDGVIIEIKAMTTYGAGGKFTIQSSAALWFDGDRISKLSIVYVDDDGLIHLDSDPFIPNLPFISQVSDFTVSSNGYHVFVATNDEIRIWNTSGITLFGQDDPQSASYGITNYNATPLFKKVTLSANENFLFVEDYYGVFHILEILALGTWQEELRYVGTCPDGSGSPSTFISLSPDGKYLYAHDNAYGYDLTIYDVESPQSMKKINKLHFPDLNSQWEPPEDGIYQSISSSGALSENGFLYGVGREGLIQFPTESWHSWSSFSENTDTASIDVTPVNDPPTIGEIGNYVWYGNEFEDTTKTIFVEGVTAGSEEWFQPLRAYASTTNSELIVSPAVQFLMQPTIFPPEPYSVSLTYTLKAGHSGSSVISLLVEDGGLDNNLSTPGDNRSSSRESNVIVLLVISDSDNEATPAGPKLARDNNFNIYVDGQPVTLNGEQIPSAINGFSFVRAESGSENALMLKPLGVEVSQPTHRLLTDETWRVNGIFNSLQNASSPVLDLSGREVSGPLSIAAVAGAYEINGVNNPTLVVRRGQAYTFNLNTAGHPFYLQTTGGGYQSANAYSDGFNGNGKTSGEHQWVVPEDTPDEIFYQCEFHPVMFGKIIVVD